MQYGAMNFPVVPVVNEIEIFSKMGFDFLELTLDAPQAHYTIIRQEKNRILRSLEKHHMGLVCHLPTFVYPADLTESIRRVSLEEILASVETVSELGAARAVLHPGPLSGMGMFAPETAKAYAIESLEKIVEKAEKARVVLCLENMPPKCGAFFEPDEIGAVLDRFPSLKFTLDVGHAHIEDEHGTRAIELIRRAGNRLSHLHISDNNGKRDEHLSVGSGTVNFPEFIKALKHHGFPETATLEIFTQDRQDLRLSRKRFEEWIQKTGK
jgi:sugar phosphate isomerase/epimerase